MVSRVDHVLGDDGVLVEVLGLADKSGAGQVHWITQGVEESVPGLGDAVVGHGSRH